MEQELYKTIVLHKSSNHFLAFEAHVIFIRIQSNFTDSFILIYKSCLWGLLFCEKSEFHLFESEILSKVRPKNSAKLEKKASVEISNIPA